MINTQLIAEVMSNHPDYHYELNTIENNVEFVAEKGKWESPGTNTRRVRKVLTSDEDIRVLDMVLKSKES